MKQVLLIITVMALVLLSACTSAASSPTPIPTITLGDNSNPSNASQSDNGSSVSAAAVIIPINDAQLSFSAIGRVTTVNVRAGDKVRAGDILVQLDTTIQEAKVREAEANLLAAQVQLKYNKRLGLDEVHIESSEADVARTQALVDSASAVLASESTLTAPFDGTIVSLNIAPAETVVPGQVLIVLGDLSKYQIETTDLSERDIPRVQTGQPANVFIEALGEEFTGKVIDVDRVSSTLGGDVVYKVTLELDQQPQGLLWGMSADVQIETTD
ncbi:MAG TPA: efflux RND transporter periplasmic adaptor subunit [Anaerolineales bacterium]|nr:efflux RND transporter periplasmic adaptor subunit [Anaerolineales bacterium]